MGWIDWLTTGIRIEVCTDCVWLTNNARWKGVCDTVRLRLAAPNPPVAVLVVAHFPQTLDELRPMLTAAAIDSPLVQATTVEALLAAAGSAAGFGTRDSLEIVCVERHFLPGPDVELVKFARGLQCRCRLSYHLSLEDPLLEGFASEWVKTVLRQLGLNEDEAIQSQMISRRIRRAQQKLVQRVVKDLPADSADEWLAINAGEDA